LAEQYEVAVSARPVYPLAVRDPEFFKRTNRQFARYVALDSRRVAAHSGIPFRFPRPDPIVQDMATLAIATEQPLIRRLTRLGAAAQCRARALPFIREVSRTLWDGTTDSWDQGEHLAQAAARAGIDLAELDAEVAADPQRLDAVISANQADHAESGHWGVPTFVFSGEPFFGQDRFDLLVWRLRQAGLTPRSM
jgi:2-hydroxychromene-2-carboxylate isomerase